MNFYLLEIKLDLTNDLNIHFIIALWKSVGKIEPFWAFYFFILIFSLSSVIKARSDLRNSLRKMQ